MKVSRSDIRVSRSAIRVSRSDIRVSRSNSKVIQNFKVIKVQVMTDRCYQIIYIVMKQVYV